MFGAFKKSYSNNTLYPPGPLKLSENLQEQAGPPLIGVTAQTFMDSQKDKTSSKRSPTQSPKVTKKKKKLEIPDQF